MDAFLTNQNKRKHEWEDLDDQVELKRVLLEKETLLTKLRTENRILREARDAAQENAAVNACC